MLLLLVLLIIMLFIDFSINKTANWSVRHSVTKAINSKCIYNVFSPHTLARSGRKRDIKTKFTMIKLGWHKTHPQPQRDNFDENTKWTRYTHFQQKILCDRLKGSEIHPVMRTCIYIYADVKMKWYRKFALDWEFNWLFVSSASRNVCSLITVERVNSKSFFVCFFLEIWCTPFKYLFHWKSLYIFSFI